MTQASLETARNLVTNVSLALQGKRDAVELAVTTLLAHGHLLIEDVPGVGKTTLARALAKSVGLTFRRLQFTSDLMPSDVVGASVYDQTGAKFVFRPGPVFTHVLLADEINRTTPKTQSALLEAMDERRVSVDGVTHQLEEPFFVVATQNPEEFYGTYPLPESQLDRFLMRIQIGYPEEAVERHVIATRRAVDPIDSIQVVASRDQILAAQRAVDEVRVDASIVEYLHRIVLNTRQSALLELGASTRSALAYERAVRAHALVKNRMFATPDDVQTLAAPVLAHRVRLSGVPGAQSRSQSERVIRDIVATLAVPI